MKIFETYTGNAMLNNALMTIEALANLKNVSEITSEILLSLYKAPISDSSLIELNKRFKSYTMIFSLNNPLVNPAKKNDKMGERTYNGIMKSIINNCETEGKYICEISGLRFEKTFEDYYKGVLKELKDYVRSKKLDEKKEKTELANLDKTDCSLNRCWFPLIGGLGSDAQALPQAKFAFKIHPICIVIMQFLPLAALLYKGGVLLIDSSNFEFARDFVGENVECVKQKIQLHKANESIENIKDFVKGNYLNKALDLLDKKEFEDDYSDLNLWSFSNSGTGASCEIDRIPNSLIQKLIRLRNMPRISNELKQIIENKDFSYSFISSLEDNKDWFGLYPAKKYDGVSVEFFEAYHRLINECRGEKSNKIEYAKYIAYLISRFRTRTFDRYLKKTDAYDERDYKIDLYSVLIKATEEGCWDLEHQLQILDNPNNLPIKNNSYGLYKMIHFFYWKESFSEKIPVLEKCSSKASDLSKWMIGLIQQDINSTKIIKQLLNPQDYNNVSYTELFLRSAFHNSVNLDNIFEAIYNADGMPSRYGLNELLRLFFSQPKQEHYDISDLQLEKQNITDRFYHWFEEINKFAKDYQTYYFDKYENKETGQKPYNKYLNQITSIPANNTHFLRWFEEATSNTNDFLKRNKEDDAKQWTDALLYNPDGRFSIAFARFAIQLSLRKTYYQIINNK